MHTFTIIALVVGLYLFIAYLKTANSKISSKYSILIRELLSIDKGYRIVYSTDDTTTIKNDFVGGYSQFFLHDLKDKFCIIWTSETDTMGKQEESWVFDKNANQLVILKKVMDDLKKLATTSLENDEKLMNTAFYKLFDDLTELERKCILCLLQVNSVTDETKPNQSYKRVLMKKHAKGLGLDLDKSLLLLEQISLSEILKNLIYLNSYQKEMLVIMNNELLTYNGKVTHSQLEGIFHTFQDFGIDVKKYAEITNNSAVQSV